MQVSKGFSLMELLVVLALIALATAVVFPKLTNNDSKLYKAQLRTLTTTLNFNRRSAVIKKRPFEMVLFPFREEQDRQDKPVKSKTKKKGDWHSQGARIQWQTGTQTIKDKPFKITYFPQGGATGGIIRLQQGRFIALLGIDGITGKVMLEELVDESES